jgi:hypothetical protein
MHIAPIRNALVAAAALAALPAFAGSYTFPGTHCSSDGPFARSLNGLLVNKATALGSNGQATTTYFYCPIVHSQPLGLSPSTLSITVTVKTASSNAEFNCWVRSVTADNVMFDQVKLVFPTSSAGPYHTTSGAQLSMPGLGSVTAPASVNMRCAVPNVVGGVDAGILSYRVDQ